MPLLNKALEMVPDALIGGAAFAPFSNANARIAVGDSSAPFDPAHTGLQGSNTAYGAMDPGLPQRTANVLKFGATFGVNEANFHWNELGIDNGSEFLSRLVEDLGQKTNAIQRVVEHEQTYVLV